MGNQFCLLSFAFSNGRLIFFCLVFFVWFSLSGNIAFSVKNETPQKVKKGHQLKLESVLLKVLLLKVLPIIIIMLQGCNALRAKMQSKNKTRQIIVLKISARKREVIGSISFLAKENVEKIYFQTGHNVSLKTISGNSGKIVVFPKDSQDSEAANKIVMCLLPKHKGISGEIMDIVCKTHRQFDLYFLANVTQVLEKSTEFVPLLY